MPLSVESEIDLLYHLSTMSEHVLPKGLFYLLLWKRLNQSGNPPAFSFNEMIEHLRILYDESVFDNPELPSSNDQDFEWQPNQTEIVEHQQQVQSQPSSQPQLQQSAQTELETSVEKDSIDKVESTPKVLKTRKRATSPSSNGNASTPNTDSSRRSSRQRNPQTKDEDEPQATPPPAKVDKRKSVKEPSRASTRSTPASDSIGTRLRGQK